VLIPAFQAAGARLRQLAANGGAGSLHAARRFGFAEATTDPNRLFSDDATSAVVVATRHDSHARFVLRALEARKHVYVEKPLCLTLEELDAIEGMYGALAAKGEAPVLTVGFNRRFSPLVIRIKELLALASGPKAMIMTVNAGAIPAGHWTQDPAVGGGRIVGEVCHFVDLLRHLACSAVERAELCEASVSTRDTLTVSLRFADGSIGAIHYFANGHLAHPKERLEVFCAGRILRLDNFRRLRGFGWGTRGSMRLWRQDKGQNGLVTAFLGAIRGELPPPIAVEELFEVARLCLSLVR
jgi:predicted dehydrogenase